MSIDLCELTVELIISQNGLAALLKGNLWFYGEKVVASCYTNL